MSLLTAPATAARQTAAAIGSDASVTHALADMDWGDWTGRSFAAVDAASPEALASWLADPASGVPGGEGFAAVARRVGAWLAAIAHDAGRIVAVTHPMVVRAVLVHAIGVSEAAAMRIDLAPLSIAELSFHRVWRLQELRRA